MHVRDERVYRFAESLFPLIKAVDVYVGEMELDGNQGQPPLPAYDARAYFKSSAYDKISAQLKKSFQFDLDALNHFHPMVIIGSITQSILTADHAVSLDEHLWQFAKENELKLSGLESVKEQMEILHSIDPGPLYRQIKQISSRSGTVRKQTAKALDLYIKGDIHELYKQTRRSLHHLRKKVIYERNLRMARRIIGLDPGQTYFIAVGAGHLSGQTGLIRLLRQAGWKVTPSYWP